MTAQATEAARFPDRKDLAGAQPGPGRARAACLPGFTDRADGHAELKLPAPADIHLGEFTATRLDGGTIRIDHADPRVLISGELLDAIAGHSVIVDGTEAFALNASLDTAACCDCFMADDYTNAVLKISGVNQTVIYRITEYVPGARCYIGEWPD